MHLKSCLAGAFRILKRRKLSTAINVAGLAAGLAAVLLLVSYVRDERSFDRYHRASGRLYIVTNEFRDNFFGGSHHFLAGMLAERFPEVRATARLDLMRLPTKTGYAPVLQQVAFVDPGLFSLLDFPASSGDPVRDLALPHQAFLSAEAARRLFSGADPAGKTISIRLAEGFRDYRIAGVLRDFPGNSSLRFDIAVGFDNSFAAQGLDPKSRDFVFLPLSAVTFLEISSPEAARSLRSKLPAFHLEIYRDMWDALKMPYPKVGFDLLRFSDYHLGDVSIGTFEPRSRRSSSTILLAVAGLILLLAGFNYVNLSLAQAVSGVKDFGLRRLAGARRSELVVRRLCQTCLEVLLAMAVGLLAALMWLKPFNALTGKRLSADGWGSLAGGGIVLGLVLATGLAAGILPALILSGAKASDVLRGRMPAGGRRGLSRALVFVQCAVSAAFLAGTVLMLRQMAFINGLDLGYQPENVVLVRTQLGLDEGDESRRLLSLFRDRLLRDPRVVAITGDAGSLVDRLGGVRRRLEKDGRVIDVQSYMVDAGYRDALGVPLLAGRDFSPDYPSDAKDAALVNETFVRTFGLKDPVGHRTSEFAADANPKGLEYDPVIIGVVRDYRQGSLRVPVGPVALDLHGMARFDFFRDILIRLSGRDVPGALKLIEDTWRQMKPDRPFLYSFLEDDLAGQYGAERNWSRIVGFSGGLALLVAGMGMFGLSSLAAVRRTKEIGIRKVLGGKITRVTSDLVREYVILWAAANAAAWPLAFWLGRAWLKGFAARAGFSPWPFLVAGCAGGLLILVPVTIRAWRAASSNPASCLRYE